MASRDEAVGGELDSSSVKDEPIQDEGNKAGGSSSVRHEETMEKTRESIKGLDEVHMALNSLDDHTQAGLQTLRTAVNHLSREQTTHVRRIATLEEQLAQALAQQEVYQAACSEAQQEIQTVTEQKDNVLEDNKFLHKQIEKLTHDYEVHLEMIAGRHRSRLLACRALRHWRNKAKQGGHNVKVRIQLLEEENQGLREELLQYQEATKQAFLRSANVLNAEALAVFQDAATRRLGDGGCPDDDDDASDGGGNKRDLSHVSASASGLVHGRGSGDEGKRPESGDNKENEQAGEPTENQGEFGWTGASSRSTDGRGGAGLVRSTSEEFPSASQPGVASSSAAGPTSSGGAPAAQQPPLAQYYPNSLRNETRARLQQLQEDQLKSTRGASSHHVESSYEPSAKSLRTTSGVGGRTGWGIGTRDELGIIGSGRSEGIGRDRHFGGNGWRGDRNGGDRWGEQVGSHICHCSNLPPKASSTASKPTYGKKFYDCPYCSPISDSSYGHARFQKSTKKVPRTSNTARNAMLASAGRDPSERREVLYKPSSTVIIERHIGRYK